MAAISVTKQPRLVSLTTSNCRGDSCEFMTGEPIKPRVAVGALRLVNNPRGVSELNGKSIVPHDLFAPAQMVKGSGTRCSVDYPQLPLLATRYVHFGMEG
ncbi:hypothetical protein Pr1d_33640 [Bythopirellula goksoeyrii]|uniref:Uncharacterized protein n=1 Tax=Bythopirellula goksoeyrii TaxID=1400387 RepID=A0A5B9QEN2_9BACT|nr:hypothetical protein Pr1d_33640 [Bythopirellula goksoeyrii]